MFFMGVSMEDYTNRKIAANYFRGAEAVGGHLLFDEQGMTFRSHRLNVQTGETRLEYADITDIAPRNTLAFIPNGIVVLDTGGFAHQFVIWHRKRVIEFLKFKRNQARQLSS